MRLTPQIDVEYTADVLFIMLDPRTIHFQLTARAYDAERITNGLIALLQHLLG